MAGARERIGDITAAAALFAPIFVGLAYEVLHVAYLDADYALVDLWTGRGASDASVTVPLRTLIGSALALGAERLIMAHNHPRGPASPSRADTVATRRLCEVARPLGIEVIDHLIFAGPDYVSFRALGLL